MSTNELRQGSELDAKANLRALIESTDDPIWSVDLNYRLLVFNNAFQADIQRNYGVRAAVGMRTEELLPPARDTLLRPLYDRALREGAFRTEYPLLDGRILEMAFNLIVEDGETKGISVFGKDITEQQAAEDALCETENKYRHLFNSVSDAVFVMKIDDDGMPGEFIDFNDRACQYLGYSRQELERLRIVDINPPERRPGIRSITRTVIDRRYWTWEGIHLAKDGRRIPVEVHARVVDLDGSPALISSVRDITERREAEVRYRDIFDGAIEGMYRTGMDGKALATNSAFANMLGYDSVQEYLSTVTDTRHQVWLDPDQRTEYLRLLETQGHMRGYEARFKRKDGAVIWVSISARTVRGADGQPHYTDGFVEDITERKMAQTALGESEANLREAQRLARIGSATWDVASDTTTYSEEMYRIIGRSPEFIPPGHAPGRPPERAKFYTPESFARISAAMQRALATGEPYELDLDVVRPDGTVRRTHASGAAVRDDSGRVVKLHGTLQDITEWKEVQARISEKDALLQLAHDAILATDLEGKIAFWNHGATELYGWAAEEALGRNVNELLQPVFPIPRAEILMLVESSGQWEGEVTHRTRTGDAVVVASRWTLYRDAEGGAGKILEISRGITDRKRADEALQQSLSQLRRAQQLAHIGTSTLDVRSDTTIWSEEMYRITGWEPGAPPRTFADRRSLYTPASYALLENAARQAVAAGEPYELDVDIIRPDGVVRQTHASGAAIRDADGNISKIVGTLQDVTEWKAAEARLSEQAALLQHAHDAIIVTDLNGVILFWNRGAEDLYGWAAKKAVGAKVHDLLRTSFPIPLAQIHEVLQDQDQWEGEITHQTQSGTAVVVASRWSLQRGEKGEPTKILEINRDITARKAAEEELKLYRQQLELALKAGHSGSFDRDIKNDVDVWSPELAALYGLAVSEFGGTSASWDCLVLPEDREIARAAVQEALRTGEYRAEWRIRRQNDGEVRWLAAQGKVFYGGDGQPSRLLGVNVDITERKRAEEALRQSQSQLLMAQKLESIGQLAAGIAHEINTPIQYIGDNATFLAEAFRDLLRFLEPHTELADALRNPARADFVTALEQSVPNVDVNYLRAEIPKATEQLLEGVARVARIVRAMKEFSHPGPVEKAPVDINRAIESTILVSKSEWKYVAELTTDLDPELPLVPCVGGEFNQVILNLIVNATHAISDVVRDSNQKGSIRISTRRDGGWAEVRVSDTGAGIPEGIRARIFTPFFTTKEVGKGTGQGLAMAHSVIVKKHQGTIHFESEIGVVTTFVVRLPLQCVGEKP